MPIHHVALATRDTQANHAFYTGPMGFSLVRVEVGPTPTGGWSKHLFYDTGDGMIAFWELHDDSIPAEFSTSISRGLGLPYWVNHVAFAARDAADLDGRRERLLEAGLDVLEVDHGWCRSIYVRDPNDILVEFCLTTRAFDASDHAAAAALLDDPAPELPAAPKPVLHRRPGGD